MHISFALFVHIYVLKKKNNSTDLLNIFYILYIFFIFFFCSLQKRVNVGSKDGLVDAGVAYLDIVNIYKHNVN